MDTLEAEDQLTIVNRSVEYRISKKLLRKIPYFQMMLSHDLQESRESKVELDFDEKAIKSMFDGIEIGCSFIEMDNAIALYDILDYFGLADSFLAACKDHFPDNFTIEHLPVVIPQVTSTTKLINSRSLNGFICRYFTKIANANVWLNYPLETIEYICKLDLMVDSEMQVFEAIMRWVTFECDSRKKCVEVLLKLVRWCHLKDEDLSKSMENELVKSLEFNPKFCSNDKGNCDCNTNRTEQEYFVMIEEWHKSNDIRIIVLANDLQPLFNRILKLDQSLPEHIMHDEHISDIIFLVQYSLYDSEQKIIRIDWKHNKYRWLYFSPYSYKLVKCISTDSTNGENFKVNVRFNQSYRYRHALLEAKDKFILINKDEDYFYYRSKPTAEQVSVFDLMSYFYAIHKETVLDNKIYMLTDSKFIELDIEEIDRKRKFKMIELPTFKKYWNLKKLHLISKQANDDRVILFDGSEKNFYCFNVNTRQWSSIGQIINYNFLGERKKTKLISLTSAFISVDFIEFA
ncbi:uncharacterized protein LOC107370998 isoform X1 [Tetranychus urticae]|uniref:uncharacterized protein LOC107370998 isoform X1 n=1 Tax=Tetranychus urticae TaxID=32264 RepID=UPI00077B8747|nr:uncharacterized protein LOC107370998 isoform X1 [Tetranychus urticae]